MNKAYEIVEGIIVPVEDCVLRSDIVQTWVEFPDVWALELVVDVLFKAGFDGQGP